MNRTLLFLLKLRARGGWRKLVRTARRPKGAILTALTVLLFSMILLPNILMRHADIPKIERVPFVQPVMLLGFWLATLATGRNANVLTFSQPEVEFLFSGPFSRRELIGYKLLVTTIGPLGSALFVPLLLSRFDLWWPAVMLGVWLTLLFIQNSTVLTILAFGWLSERFAGWWIVLVGVLALLLAGALVQSGVAQPGLNWLERIDAFEAAPIVQVVLAPLVVFSNLAQAKSATALAGWGSVALAANALAIALVLWMDQRFVEASLGASQRRYEFMERARRRGNLMPLVARSKPRFSLPAFPRLAGAGPVAWRQSLELLRNSTWLILFLPAVIAIGAPSLLVGGGKIAVPVVAMTVFIAFFMSMIMPMGLRTDLPHIEVLKSLPLRSGAIVWGSIASAVLYPTLVQWLAVGVLAALARQWPLACTLTVVFAVPLNLLFVCADSVLVLIYPSAGQMNPNDLLAGARMMLAYMVKMLFVAAAAGVAGVVAFLVSLASGQSVAAIAVAAWIVLVAQGVVVIALASVLFERFDPSLDPGGEK